MTSGGMDAEYPAAIDGGKLSGVIVCATDAAGNFVYNKTWGERTLLSGEKRSHQLDDVLSVASATKLMTTIAALQCVEDGLLSPFEDVARIAPELAGKQVITGFSDDGETPLLEPQAHHITLEMLLSHSSGIGYHFLDPLIMRWRQKFAPPVQAADGSRQRQTVEELISFPLIYQPGQGWMYGAGLDWAGRIVERVTGKTLGERMQERIFGPLSIDAQFYPVTREDLRERMVDLNPNDPDGLGKAVVGGSGDHNLSTKGDFGGHGLFMTASGYIKVLHSLLANDGKILKQATVDTMFEHHLSPESTAEFKIKRNGPLGDAFRLGTAPNAEAGYGLSGHLTLDDVDGWHGERTLSWGGGVTFPWFIDRKNDLCGLCALQATMPVDFAAVERLKQTFRRDIYRKRAALKTRRTSLRSDLSLTLPRTETSM